MSQVSQELPVVTLSEWQSSHLGDKVLNEEDRRLASLLDSGDRLGIDELRTGLRIAARSWVGVVRFSSFELRVVPKLVGENLGLVKLIDFAGGLDCLDRHPAVHTFQGGGSSLLDLVALLLAEACERVSRAGLLADYREVEDDLPVVRGRLIAARQVLKRFGRIDRLECRYDEHTTDTADNQILLAALSACSGRVAHPVVALRIRRLLALFSEACSTEELDLRAVRANHTYNRLNEHYREPHALAWLVLDGLGVEDIFAGGSQRCFAFLLDMNRLFEDFVTRWLTKLLQGSPYRVLPQRRDRTILWNAALNSPYTSVIPDLLVERRDKPGQFLPIDAKYKLYGEQRLSPADIYQSFLYAFAYGERSSSALPTAVIVYPASSSVGAKVRLHVRRSSGSASAELQGIGIAVPAALDEAKMGQPKETGRPFSELISAALDPLPERNG